MVWSPIPVSLHRTLIKSLQKLVKRILVNLSTFLKEEDIQDGKGVLRIKDKALDGNLYQGNRQIKVLSEIHKIDDGLSSWVLWFILMKWSCQNELWRTCTGKRLSVKLLQDHEQCSSKYKYRGQFYESNCSFFKPFELLY